MGKENCVRNHTLWLTPTMCTQKLTQGKTQTIDDSRVTLKNELFYSEVNVSIKGNIIHRNTRCRSRLYAPLKTFLNALRHMRDP